MEKRLTKVSCSVGWKRGGGALPSNDICKINWLIDIKIKMDITNIVPERAAS